MRKIDWEYAIGFITIFTIMLLFISVIFIISVEQAKERYEMPDGAICKYKSESFTGATYEFSGCSNSKTYINPETYKRFRE